MIQVAGFFVILRKSGGNQKVPTLCKIMFKKIMPQKWKQAHPRNITEIMIYLPCKNLPFPGCQCVTRICLHVFFTLGEPALFFALSFPLLLGGGASQYTIVILSALVYTSPGDLNKKNNRPSTVRKKNKGEDVATLQGVPYHFPKYSHILPNTSHI